MTPCGSFAPASLDAMILQKLGSGTMLLSPFPCSCRFLFLPIEDRSDWLVLRDRVVALLNQLLANSPTQKKVTLVAESFGGCLALRVAVVAPHLLERLILVNPATCFARSYSGIPNFVANTNLLVRLLYCIVLHSYLMMLSYTSTHGQGDREFMGCAGLLSRSMF